MNTHIGAIYRVKINMDIKLEPKDRIVRRFIPTKSIHTQIPFRFTKAVGLNEDDALTTLIKDIASSGNWRSYDMFRNEIQKAIDAKVREYNKISAWVQYQIQPGSPVDTFLYELPSTDVIMMYFAKHMVEMELVPWGVYRDDIPSLIKDFDCMGVNSQTKLFDYAHEILSELSAMHMLEKILPIHGFETLLERRDVEEVNMEEVSDDGE